MSNSSTTIEKIGLDQKILSALRIGAIFLLVYLAYRILAPFIPLVLWGAIMAVAIYPLHLRMAAWIGDRINISATLITLLGLIILIVPLIILTESLVTGSMSLADGISSGEVHVPSPPEWVQAWPMVGEKLYGGWLLASENFGAALQQFGPQLEALRASLIAIAGGVGGASLQMFGSIIIAGVFLGTADSCLAKTRSIFSGFVGERGPLLLAESETTIRSVARGVLGRCRSRVDTDRDRTYSSGCARRRLMDVSGPCALYCPGAAPDFGHPANHIRTSYRNRLRFVGTYHLQRPGSRD